MATIDTRPLVIERPTPAPTPTPRPTLPLSTRTGTSVDALLSAMEAKDRAAIAALVRFTPIPCQPEEQVRGPAGVGVACRAGEAVGTAVPAFFFGAGEWSWYRADPADHGLGVATSLTKCTDVVAVLHTPKVQPATYTADTYLRPPYLMLCGPISDGDYRWSHLDEGGSIVGLAHRSGVFGGNEVERELGTLVTNSGYEVVVSAWPAGQ